MESPSKRVMTMDNQALSSTPDIPSQTGISPDVTARLRGLGSRVRKKGYSVPPSLFTKSKSTGLIFRSANDTLRDVYTSVQVFPESSAPALKRSRPSSDHEEDNDNDNDQMITRLDQGIADQMPIFLDLEPHRNIKPLRKSRKLITETRSLPNGSFSFFDHPNEDPAMLTKSEDDWSEPSLVQTLNSGETPFEPMVL